MSGSTTATRFFSISNLVDKTVGPLIYSCFMAAGVIVYIGSKVEKIFARYEEEKDGWDVLC